MKNNKVGRLGFNKERLTKKGFKKYQSKNPCRECIYRKKSLAKQIQGSFIAQSGEAYFFVMNGIQWYCHQECKDVPTTDNY